MSVETVYAGLTQNAYHLWVAGNAVAVTEFRTYPTGLRAFNILLTGGEDPGWNEVAEELGRHALRAGCVKLETSCRKGWSRILKGWKETTIDMERDLLDG